MILDESVLRRTTALQEMLRLCRSIAADGKVTEAEAKAFQAWIERHPDMAGIHPVDRFVRILRRVFADGHLSEEECEELMALLAEVT